MGAQTIKMLAVCVVLIVTAMLGAEITRAELCSEESTLTRSFSSTSVCTGEIITVMLDVVIRGGATFYLFNEYVPDGWTVIDDGGGGGCSPANRLCWVVISNAEDTTYTYTIQAPSLAGSYDFEGTFMFEGFTESKPIIGETTVNVIERPECEVLLTIGEANAHPGDESVQVLVKLSNQDHELLAIETLLVDTPDNLTCTGCIPDPVRAPEFMCLAYDQGEEGCKVVMVDYTDPTGVIEQGDGPIFTVDYMISECALSNECISVTPTESIIADNFEESLNVCEESGGICFISCGDVYPGESCGDGVVNIFDILEVIDIVLNIGEHSDCQLDQADVPNGIPPNCREPDGGINIFDVLVIVDKALDKPNCCDYTTDITEDIIPPAPPPGLRIENGDSSEALPLRLVWESNTEAYLAFYTVYYGTSSRNYTHLIDESNDHPYHDFRDGQLMSGETYYLTVTATDFWHNESNYSIELEVFIEP